MDFGSTVKGQGQKARKCLTEAIASLHIYRYSVDAATVCCYAYGGCWLRSATNYPVIYQSIIVYQSATVKCRILRPQSVENYDPTYFCLSILLAT